jgi:hypothetical protein
MLIVNVTRARTTNGFFLTLNARRGTPKGFGQSIAKSMSQTACAI